MTPIACLRVYEVAAPARAAWHALFARIFRMADVSLETIIHSAPTPIDALWARTDMGCVFMCGYPIALRLADVVPIAAPVPDADWAQGRAAYRSDLIVRADDDARLAAQAEAATAILVRRGRSLI